MLPFLSGAQEKTTKPCSPDLKEGGQARTVRQSNTKGNQQAIEWNWSPGRKGFNVKASGGGPVILEDVDGSVEINGKILSLKNAQVVSLPKEVFGNGGGQYRIEYSLPEINCLWTWEFAYIDKGLEITATLQNTGSAPITIGNWDVVHMNAQGGKFKTGKSPANVRFFRWRPWDMRIELLACEDGRHSSDNLCLLFDPLSKQTFMSAFITMDRMHCHHEVSYSPSNGIEDYKATCTFGKYKLNPNMRLASEKLRMSFYNDPYKALEGWADQIYVLKKPVFEDMPPVGIINCAWQISGDQQNYEELTLGNAYAIRERLKGFDIRYNWISQGNLKGGIPGNWTNSDGHNIPDGLDTFFKKLKKLGFIPGLWVAPFWFCSEADGVLEENRENLLKDCNGEPVSELLNWGGDLGDSTPWTSLHKYFLDGTHPKTTEYKKKNSHTTGI